MPAVMDRERIRPALAIAVGIFVAWVAWQTVFSGFHFSLRLLLLAVGAAALGWMAYQHVYGMDERPRTMIALAVVLAAVGFLEYRAQSMEQQFSKAASYVAKRDVSVRCQGIFGNLVDIGQELGTVQFSAEGDPADVTHIKRDACGWAADYARGNRRVTREHAVAIQVIAHEAIHLRGWTDESVTECYGMQNMVDVAMQLGASRQEGRNLADLYYRMLYPMMPDEYRNESLCQNDGEWDIRKGDPNWPQ